MPHTCQRSGVAPVNGAVLIDVHYDNTSMQHYLHISPFYITDEDHVSTLYHRSKLYAHFVVTKPNLCCVSLYVVCNSY